jgi:hypothetical protein
MPGMAIATLVRPCRRQRSLRGNGEPDRLLVLAFIPNPICIPPVCRGIALQCSLLKMASLIDPAHQVGYPEVAVGVLLEQGSQFKQALGDIGPQFVDGGLALSLALF